MKRRKISPPLFIISTFVMVIMCGTLLLMLPFSTKSGITLIDALFTETSAVCVTGLIVKNTGQDFTIFGQIIILLSIQLGGLGIMTIATFFYQIIKKDLTLKRQLVIKELVAKNDFYDISNLIVKVISYTFVFELFGTIFFAISFIPKFGFGKGLFYSVFHSVSSFCNAGFSNFVDSFAQYYNSPVVILTSAFLLIFGGLGFLVLYEFFDLNIFKKGANLKLKKLSIQTKIMLTGTIGFLVFGTIVMYLLESTNTMKGMTFFQKIMVSFYHSASPRTAGFSIIDIGSIKPVTMIINEILMFIGAGPGSTAGGIKITTFILLSMIFLSFIKQKDSVVMYKKFIPQIIVYRTISIFLFAISWLIFAYTILLATKQQIPATLSQDASHRLLFELISAFGTVGLSTGITNYLNLIGKIVIIITMFFGRLGPTVIAVTIRRSEYPVQIEYPEEQVMVG